MELNTNENDIMINNNMIRKINIKMRGTDKNSDEENNILLFLME